MKKILMLVAILLIAAPAFANSNTACVSGSVLEKNVSILSNGVTNTTSEQTNCPYGCANNQCTPAATLNQWNSLVIIIIFAALLIAGVTSESNPMIILSGCVLLLFSALLGTQGILYDSVLVKNTSTGGLGVALAFGALYLVIGSVAEWRAKGREE